MKNKPSLLRLLIGLALCVGVAYGQGALGPTPKKPRTLEDYKPGTLKESVKEDPKREGLLPLRVKAILQNSVRPISKNNKAALDRWAQCCAGSPDHYTKAYIREMQFAQDGTAYWLPVQDTLVADIQEQVKAGEAVDLFLIRVSAPGSNGKSVLLVERFQRIQLTHDQAKESLDWIKSNLSSSTGKDLKVEILERCQLKITDSVNSASVSKAVVFIPLADLDISKVSVEPHQGSHALWIHTTAGRSSIRFMVYQGSPAEGGQADKYSLDFPDPEKAEAMAEAFRRAINLCAAAKSQGGS